MARRKSAQELSIPKDLIENQPNKYLMADELEKKLDTFGKDVATMMAYGSMPELLELSWEMFEKFKKGEIKELEGSDKDLQEYFAFKKKDLIVKLLGFMDMASNALLDTNKIKHSSIKEITNSLKITLDMLNALQGTSIAKKVEHTHVHEVKHVDDLDERIRKTKEELDSIEAEFEDVTDTNTDF